MESIIVYPPFIGCGVFIRYKRFLVLQLRDTKESKPTILNPNTWALVGGGREQNETPLQTIQREWEEEIIYRGEVMFEEILYDHTSKKYYFLVNITKKEIKTREGQRIDFFSFKQIQEINNRQFQSLGGAVKKVFMKYPNDFKKLIRNGDSSFLSNKPEFIKGV